jgi:hypothetical protein
VNPSSRRLRQETTLHLSLLHFSPLVVVRQKVPASVSGASPTFHPSHKAELELICAVFALQIPPGSPPSPSPSPARERLVSSIFAVFQLPADRPASHSAAEEALPTAHHVRPSISRRERAERTAAPFPVEQDRRQDRSRLQAHPQPQCEGDTAARTGSPQGSQHALCVWEVEPESACGLPVDHPHSVLLSDVHGDCGL